MWWLIIAVAFLSVLYGFYWFVFGKDPKRQAADDLVPELDKESEAFKRMQKVLEEMRGAQ